MKTQVNRKIYWLIPVVWGLIALLLWTNSQAGIVRNATSSQNGQDSISIPLYVTDSAGNRVPIDTTTDWGYIVVRYPNGSKASSDSFMIRGTNTAKIIKDAAEFGGFLQYAYRKQISDLDGTPTNGVYSFEVITRDSSTKLWTVVKIGEFQLYQTTTFAAANDSFTNAIKDANKVNFKDNAIGVKLAATGSDADTGIAGIKTRQTTILGYTDDIGVAGAGLTQVRLGVRGLESDTSFATTKAKIYTLSAGSGVTLAQLDSVLDLFVSGDSLVTLIWNAASRTLTSLDEDVTTLDLNNTTIGTALIVNTLNGIANNVITAASIADGAIDSATYASSAKTGLAFYVWNSSSRTLTVASADTTSILAMLTNNKFFQMPYDSFTVTVAGASAPSMFVTNRLSATSSGFYTERLLVWSKLAGSSVNIPSSVTRFVNNGTSDTMSVCDGLPASIAVGDQGRIYALPWPCFATLNETMDSTAVAILDADTSSHINPGSTGESIARGGTGGSGNDSALTKEMLENNGMFEMRDSVLVLAGTTTGSGSARRSEISTKAEVIDSAKKTPMTIGTNNDKTNYSLSASGVDAIWDEPKAGHTTAGTYGYYLDSRVSAVSGGSGGDCAGIGDDTTDIYVIAEDDSLPFSGVYVTYYMGAERLVVRTDTTGRARFAGTAGSSYTAIVSARPYTHDNAYIAAGTADTIWMQSTSNEPTLTPVCGTIRGTNGAPLKGVIVTATNRGRNITIGNYTIARLIVSQPTDDFGRFTLWLYPTEALGGAGYKYDFTAYRGVQLIQSVNAVTVPDRSTCWELDWTP